MKKLLFLSALFVSITMNAQTEPRSFQYRLEECNGYLFLDVKLRSTDTFAGWTYNTNALTFVANTSSPSGYNRTGVFRLKAGNHNAFVQANYHNASGGSGLLPTSDEDPNYYVPFNFQYAPKVIYQVLGPLTYIGPNTYRVVVYEPYDGYFEDEGIIIDYVFPTNWIKGEVGDNTCIFVQTGAPINTPPSYVFATLVSDSCGTGHGTWGEAVTVFPHSASYSSNSPNSNNQFESQLLQSQVVESIATTNANVKATKALIYDVFGTLVYSCTISNNNFDVKSIAIKKGSYIVKTQYSDGSEQSEKVILGK